MAHRLDIRQTFAALRQQRRLALMPFVPAGYPDLQTTAALLPALDAAGADVIEVGIPFSDPIADGPVIQAAFTAALKNKLRLTDIFATVAQARERVNAPMVAMVSYSIVFRYGVNQFLREAKTAGFDGLILPDLPPPEAQSVCRLVRAAGIDTILLVAPSTPPSRREEIAHLSSGFVYYLSVSGITGERDQLPADLSANVAALKKITALPVCVGFGVSKPKHLAQLAGVADGAIVGSALVKQMNDHVSEGPAKIAAAAAAFCGELLKQVR